MTTNFDFLYGTWSVRNRRLARRLAQCTEWDDFPSTLSCWRLFNGAANVDEIRFPTLGYYGSSLRVRQPTTGEWSIYWVNSIDGALQPPVTGGFADNEFIAYGADVHETTPITVRYHWSRITDRSAQWEQAFSVDAGRTWETNWIMELALLSRTPIVAQVPMT